MTNPTPDLKEALSLGGLIASGLILAAIIIAHLLGKNALRNALARFLPNNWKEGIVALRESLRPPVARFHVSASEKVAVLRQFYGTGSSSGLQSLGYSVDEAVVRTSIYTRPSYLSANRISLSLDMVEAKEPGLGVSQSPQRQRLEKKTKERFNAEDKPISNDENYRLVSFSGFDDKIVFSRVRYLDYRYSEGLLEDELSEAIGSRQPSDFGEIAKSLSWRNELISNVRQLQDLRSRNCLGGMGALVAIKTPTHYLLPLAQRSSKVADNELALTTIPKGFHQPLAGIGDENIHWTTLREFAEEIGGVEEVRNPSPQWEKDWYVEKYPHMLWFRENADLWRIETVSFGLNALTGNYEFAQLFIIDESFFSTHRAHLKLSWEADRRLELRSDDCAKIKSTLLTENWASEAIFHFVEGLTRLQQIDPERVRLPTIRRRLGN